MKNSIARHARAAYIFSPAKLFELRPFPFTSSILMSSGISGLQTSLKVVPSRGRRFLGENLCRKFCRLEGSSTGRLESRQIPWDVSSQTIAVKRARCTAHGIIPVSFYLTGLIEGIAIVVALCRGQNLHGPINSSGRGLFGTP